MYRMVYTVPATTEQAAKAAAETANAATRIKLATLCDFHRALHDLLDSFTTTETADFAAYGLHAIHQYKRDLNRRRSSRTHRRRGGRLPHTGRSAEGAHCQERP